jgi:hypothetical protein
MTIYATCPLPDFVRQMPAPWFQGEVSNSMLGEVIRLAKPPEYRNAIYCAYGLAFFGWILASFGIVDAFQNAAPDRRSNHGLWIFGVGFTAIYLALDGLLSVFR